MPLTPEGQKLCKSLALPDSIDPHTPLRAIPSFYAIPWSPRDFSSKLLRAGVMACLRLHKNTVVLVDASAPNAVQKALKRLKPLLHNIGDSVIVLSDTACCPGRDTDFARKTLLEGIALRMQTDGSGLRPGDDDDSFSISNADESAFEFPARRQSGSLGSFMSAHSIDVEQAAHAGADTADAAAATAAADDGFPSRRVSLDPKMLSRAAAMGAAASPRGRFRRNPAVSMDVGPAPPSPAATRGGGSDSPFRFRSQSCGETGMLAFIPSASSPAHPANLSCVIPPSSPSKHSIGGGVGTGSSGTPGSGARGSGSGGRGRMPLLNPQFASAAGSTPSSPSAVSVGGFSALSIGQAEGGGKWTFTVACGDEGSPSERGEPAVAPAESLARNHSPRARGRPVGLSRLALDRPTSTTPRRDSPSHRRLTPLGFAASPLNSPRTRVTPMRPGTPRGGASASPGARASPKPRAALPAVRPPPVDTAVPRSPKQPVATRKQSLPRAGAGATGPVPTPFR